MKFKILMMAVIALMLTACVGEASDIDRWMQEQKDSARQVTPTLTEPMKETTPEMYTGRGLPSPFDVDRLKTKTKDGGVPLCYQEQLALRDGRSGELESYPLENMRAVGYIRESKGSKALALVEIDSAVFKAYIGEYIGLDFGRITGISDSEVHITEVLYIPETNPNECVSRNVTLRLQGGAE